MVMAGAVSQQRTTHAMAQVKQSVKHVGDPIYQLRLQRRLQQRSRSGEDWKDKLRVGEDWRRIMEINEGQMRMWNFNRQQPGIEVFEQEDNVTAKN